MMTYHEKKYMIEATEEADGSVAVCFDGKWYRSVEDMIPKAQVDGAAVTALPQKLFKFEVITMTDFEILQRAKQYIDSLANGFDPLSGKPVRDDDVVNQVRISRCLFYVSGVLQKVIDNGGEIQRKKKPKPPKPVKEPFFLTHEQIILLQPQNTALSATKVAGIANELIDTEKMEKLKTTDLIRWLLSIGMLTEVESATGRKRKVPTPNGEMLGMKETSFINEQGVPTQYTVYDKNAQQFIFDNMETLIAFIHEREAEK